MGGVVAQKGALFLGTGSAWRGVDNGGVVAQKGALFLGTGRRR